MTATITRSFSAGPKFRHRVPAFQQVLQSRTSRQDRSTCSMGVALPQELTFAGDIRIPPATGGVRRQRGGSSPTISFTDPRDEIGMDHVRRVLLDHVDQVPPSASAGHNERVRAVSVRCPLTVMLSDRKSKEPPTR